MADLPVELSICISSMFKKMFLLSKVVLKIYNRNVNKAM